MNFDWFRYRCTGCGLEPEHVVYVANTTKVVKLGSCKCKGARTLELVPLTERKFKARLA